jgi:hypothetical protein
MMYKSNQDEDDIINRMPFSSQKNFNFRDYIAEEGIDKTPHDEFNYMSDVFKKFEAINSKHRFIHSYFRNVHEAALTKLSTITQLKNVTLMDSSEASFNYVQTEETFENQDRLAMILDSGSVDKITLMMYSLAIIFESSLTDSTKNIYIMFELPKDIAMFNMCKMALTQVCGQVTIIEKGKISKSRSELDKPDTVKDEKDMSSIARQRKVNDLVNKEPKNTSISDITSDDGSRPSVEQEKKVVKENKVKESKKKKEIYTDDDQSID